jgi:hypothetical protein
MIDESKRGKGVSEEKYEESRNVEERRERWMSWEMNPINEWA